MGNRPSHLTPFPSNYIAITIRPKNELWICQGPQQFIDFIRCHIGNIWPHFDYKERHCNAPKKNQTTCNDYSHPLLRNTVFKIPTEPYAFSPSHQSVEVAESAYHLVMVIVAYLYSMDYKMVSSGHFIQGTEASTCLFRCDMDCQQMGHLSKPAVDCHLAQSTTCGTLSSKPPRTLELDPAKRMLAVGLEGWNRLYCINFTHKLVSELAEYLQRLWPRHITFRKLKNSPSSGRPNGKTRSAVISELENRFSFLVEIEGHPWDSYKEHSDLTPFLVLSLIEVLKNAGFDFECRANIRGLLDTLFFSQSKVMTHSNDNVLRICLSMCHQNTFRIYGGTPIFCNWVNQMLQQLWIYGVASEKQISCGKPEEDAVQEIETNFTEIKLKGTPFCIPEWDKENYLAAQYMIGRLIGVLSLIGWQLTAFINAYSSPYDKGLLIFEKLPILNDDNKPLDLEVVELRMLKEENDRLENANLFDLLRTLCFSSYEVDHFCVLGGSQKFMQSLNNNILELFDTSPISRSAITCKCYRKCPSNPVIAIANKDTSISNKWITSRMPYQPELLRETTVNPENAFSCLLSPNQDNLALTAIFELDPDNILEYAANCQIWNASNCWLTKVFHKASAQATKFFHLSQIPLAVLCWINEFITSAAFCGTGESSDQEGTSDGNEIVQLTPSSQPPRQLLLDRSSESTLAACFDCASTVRNGPPVWIYIIKEGKQPVVVESKHVFPSQ